jgi:phosphoglycerate dehydrogenase-like enzyme
MNDRHRIVVLDDYEESLRKTADWKPIQAQADVTFHTRRLRGDELLAAVVDADVIVLIRDRTPFKADLLAKLPRLKLFVFTGLRNTQLDAAALAARAIPVCNTDHGSSKHSTSEMAWALILAAAKRPEEYLAPVRRGEWRGRRRVPSVPAASGWLVGSARSASWWRRVGPAFGMDVVTWSPVRRRSGRGCRRPSRWASSTCSTSKVVSLHLVPAEGTRKLINAERMALMRTDSILQKHGALGTHRHGSAACRAGCGASGIAALDVYDDEPLAGDHALVKRRNVVLSPHLGFVNDPVFSRYGPTWWRSSRRGSPGRHCRGSSSPQSRSCIREDPGRLLEACVVDLEHDAVQVGHRVDPSRTGREPDFRREGAGLVERPYLLAVVGGEELRGEAAEETPQVIDVAHQHARGVVVARGVHRLGQVDDHGPVGAEQDVEFAQVAVDHARAPNMRTTSRTRR